jgi:hypothetical protein
MSVAGAARYQRTNVDHSLAGTVEDIGSLKLVALELEATTRRGGGKSSSKSGGASEKRSKGRRPSNWTKVPSRFRARQ